MYTSGWQRSAGDGASLTCTLLFASGDRRVPLLLEGPLSPVLTHRKLRQEGTTAPAVFGLNLRNGECMCLTPLLLKGLVHQLPTRR